MPNSLIEALAALWVNRWTQKAKDKPTVVQPPLFGSLPPVSKPVDIDFYTGKPINLPSGASGTPKPSLASPQAGGLPTAPNSSQPAAAAHPHEPAGSPKGGQFAPKPYKPDPLACKYEQGADGKRHCINPLHSETQVTGPAQWADGSQMAVWASGSPAPKVLNGIPIKTWTPPEKDKWGSVAGQNEFPEPSLPVLLALPPKQDKDGKWYTPHAGHISAGVICVEPDGRFWVVQPKHNYGGYTHTFPKGTVDKGEGLQATAIREAYEESGLKVKLVGFLGDYKGDTSTTRYYFAVRSNGSPADFGHETHQVKLVPSDQLRALLNKPRDQQIFDDLVAKGFIHLPKGGETAKAFEEAKHPRKPVGESAGGQFAPKWESEPLVLPQTFWVAHHKVVDDLKSGSMDTDAGQEWTKSLAHDEQQAVKAGALDVAAYYKTMQVVVRDALAVAAGNKPTSTLMGLQGEKDDTMQMSPWQAAQLPWLKGNPYGPKDEPPAAMLPINQGVYLSTINGLKAGVTKPDEVLASIAQTGAWSADFVNAWKKALADYGYKTPEVFQPQPVTGLDDLVPFEPPVPPNKDGTMESAFVKADKTHDTVLLYLRKGGLTVAGAKALATKYDLLSAQAGDKYTGAQWASHAHAIDKAVAEFTKAEPLPAPSVDQSQAIAGGFATLKFDSMHPLSKSLLKSYLDFAGTDAVVGLSKIHGALDALEKEKFPGAHMAEAIKYGTVDALLVAVDEGDARAASIKAEMGKAKPVLNGIGQYKPALAAGAHKFTADETKTYDAVLDYLHSGMHSPENSVSAMQAAMSAHEAQAAQYLKEGAPQSAALFSGKARAVKAALDAYQKEKPAVPSSTVSSAPKTGVKSPTVKQVLAAHGIDYMGQHQHPASVTFGDTYDAVKKGLVAGTLSEADAMEVKAYYDTLASNAYQKNSGPKGDAWQKHGDAVKAAHSEWLNGKTESTSAPTLGGVGQPSGEYSVSAYQDALQQMHLGALVPADVKQMIDEGNTPHVVNAWKKALRDFKEYPNAQVAMTPAQLQASLQQHVNEHTGEVTKETVDALAEVLASQLVLRTKAASTGIAEITLTPYDEALLDRIWDSLAVSAKAFEEVKHPRKGKGDPQGGEFAPKAGVDTSNPPTFKVRINNQIPLKEISDWMGRPNLTMLDLCQMTGAPSGAHIKVDFLGTENSHIMWISATHPSIKKLVYMYNKDAEGNLWGMMDELFLMPDARSQGMGTQMFARQVRALKRLGFTSLKLFAGKGSDDTHKNMVGYYVWPRLGFDTELNEISDTMVRDNALAQFPKAKRLSDLMKTQRGRDWWKSKGVAAGLSFDLSAGSTSLKVLDKYITEKGYTLKGARTVTEIADDFASAVWARFKDEAAPPSEKPKKAAGKQWTTVDGKQCRWVTMHGTHVCITEAGEFVHEMHGDDGKPTHSVTFSAGQSETIKKTLSKLERGATTPDKVRGQIENMKTQASWLSSAQALEHALAIHEGKATPPEGLFKPHAAKDPNAPKKEIPLPDLQEKPATKVDVTFGNVSPDTVASWTQSEPLRDAATIAALSGAPDGAKVSVGASMKKGITLTVIHPDMSYTVYVKKGAGGAPSVTVTNLAIREGAPPDALAALVARQVQGAHQVGVKTLRLDKVAVADHAQFAREQLTAMGFDGKLPPAFLMGLPVSFPTKGLNTVSDLTATPEGQKLWRGFGGNVPLEFNVSPRSGSMKALAAYMQKIRADGAPSIHEDTTTPPAEKPMPRETKAAAAASPVAFTRGTLDEARSTLGMPKLDDSAIHALTGALPDSKVEGWNGKIELPSGEVAKSASFTVQHPLIDSMSVKWYQDQTGKHAIFDLLFLKDSAPAGTGTGILHQQVQALREAGFKDISTEAGAGGGANGYYTWPRLGFDKVLSQSDKAGMPAAFKNYTHLSDLMKTKEGRDWWKEQHRAVDVTFDLAPDSVSSKMLEAYVAEKGIANKSQKTPRESNLRLTPEEEAALDRVWDALGRANPPPSAENPNLLRARVAQVALPTKEEFAQSLLATKAFEAHWDATFKAKYVPHTEGKEECHWVTVHGAHVCINETGGHVRIVKGPAGLVQGYEHFNKPQNEIIARHLAALESGKRTLDDLKARLATLEKDTTEIKHRMDVSDATHKRLLAAHVSRNQQEMAALKHVIERKEDGGDVPVPPVPVAPVAEKPPAPTPEPEMVKEEPKPAEMPIVVAKDKEWANQLVDDLAKSLGHDSDLIRLSLLNANTDQKRRIRSEIEGQIFAEHLEKPDAYLATLDLNDEVAYKTWAKATVGGGVSTAQQRMLKDLPMYDLQAVQHIVYDPSLLNDEDEWGQTVANYKYSSYLMKVTSKANAASVVHEVGHAVHGIFGRLGQTVQVVPFWKKSTGWKKPPPKEPFTPMGYAVKGKFFDATELASNKKLLWGAIPKSVPQLQKMAGAPSGYGLKNDHEFFAEHFRIYHEWAANEAKSSTKHNVKTIKDYRAMFPEMARIIDAHYTAALLACLAQKEVW